MARTGDDYWSIEVNREGLDLLFEAVSMAMRHYYYGSAQATSRDGELVQRGEMEKFRTMKNALLPAVSGASDE